MSRIVNSVWNEEQGTDADPNVEAVEWKSCGTWNKPKEVRENCPYKEGDIIKVNFGGDGHSESTPPDIKLCRIYDISCEYLPGQLDWIAKFLVQFQTKKGKWSKVWTRVYPGDIYRAYFDYKHRPWNLNDDEDVR
jgi:hypothetical protein